MTFVLCILLGFLSHHSPITLNLPPFNLSGWYVFFDIGYSQQGCSLAPATIIILLSPAVYFFHSCCLFWRIAKEKKEENYYLASSKTSFMGWPCCLVLVTLEELREESQCFLDYSDLREALKEPSLSSCCYTNDWLSTGSRMKKAKRETWRGSDY